MRKIVKRVARGAVARFLKIVFKPFRPKELFFKQLKYRGKSFVVLANEDIGWRLISKRRFEQAEITCLEQLIREEDFCLDIGGNIGIYTVFMAAKAVRGKVVAFEPVPLNRRIFELNVLLNGSKNVELRDCAISDRSEFITFSVSDDGAYSSIIPTLRKEEEGSLLVQSRTLDELFTKNEQKVDIIKMDVEGAELLVLQGGRKLLSDTRLRPRLLLIELSRDNSRSYDYQPEDVIKFMEKFGYGFHWFGEKRLNTTWPSGRKTVDGFFLHNSEEENIRNKLSEIF